MSEKTSKKAGPWAKRVGRFGRGARNAFDLMRHGRLGAPYRAAHDVVHVASNYRLRRYVRPSDAPAQEVGALLLVPPLMVTAEVYDISPELSAVAFLGALGIDCWVVDFGAPETEAGGMDRTLDDHILGVSDAIERIAEATGRPVHVAGYSQGGMFAYQATALRRSRDVASVITFGSPVDIHRNIPNVKDEVAEKLLHAARGLITAPLAQVPGLPGVLTSTVFKLLSARKEAAQIASFWANLHDREAITRNESRRRFLGGEGFVAWPGPALRRFVDDFIVNNRMASGGFVVDGQSVSLSDIHCPILYFVGLRDELARPASVRAIENAAPRARSFSVDVRAGHFGLVVGSTALRVTWPTVYEWMRWQHAQQEIPMALSGAAAARAMHDDDEVGEVGFEAVDFRVGDFYDIATDSIDAIWNGLGEVSREIGDIVDGMRWQLPRLAKMRRTGPTSRVGIGFALAEQAAAIPHQAFFLWEGRAFSYGDANKRVDNVVRGLIAVGIVPNDRVAVYMRSRPSYLVTVAALNRLGAVSVLLGPDMPGLSLERAIALSGAQAVVTDPEGAERSRAAMPSRAFVLGGGASRGVAAGVRDLEAIEPSEVALPSWYVPNAGLGADLALIVFTSGEGSEEPRAVKVSNRRWALAALGAAATATLSTSDTVYCAMPMYHAMGMLIAISGGLVGGSRIAAAPRFTPSRFWEDIRRSGATVVFYSGDMLRLLLIEPSESSDARHPVRMFAGSGLRADDQARFGLRFGNPEITEFYASTEGPIVLVNSTGGKPGSVGRPLPDAGEIALVDVHLESMSARRNPQGRCRVVGAGEPGLLIGRVDPAKPFGSWDGFVDPSTSEKRLLRNVIEDGDVWFSTGDMFRCDSAGDYFFLGRKAEMFATPDGPRSLRELVDLFERVPGVGLAASWSIGAGELRAIVATCSTKPGVVADFSDLVERLQSLPAELRPALVRVVGTLPLSASLRVNVSLVRQQVVDVERDTLWVLSADGRRYVPVTSRNRSRVQRLLEDAATTGRDPA